MSDYEKNKVLDFVCDLVRGKFQILWRGAVRRCQFSAQDGVRI